MEPVIYIFFALAALLGTVLWIYEHPTKDKNRKSGRGGDFEE